VVAFIVRQGFVGGNLPIDHLLDPVLQG